MPVVCNLLCWGKDEVCWYIKANKIKFTDLGFKRSPVTGNYEESKKSLFIKCQWPSQTDKQVHRRTGQLRQSPQRRLTSNKRNYSNVKYNNVIDIIRASLGVKLIRQHLKKLSLQMSSDLQRLKKRKWQPMDKTMALSIDWSMYIHVEVTHRP